jgi:hypothetical protein
MSPSCTTCVVPAAQWQVSVDDAGGLQDLDEAIVGAVHVADGNDAVDAGPLAFVGGVQRPRDGEREEDDDRAEMTADGNHRVQCTS